MKNFTKTVKPIVSIPTAAVINTAKAVKMARKPTTFTAKIIIRDIRH